MTDYPADPLSEKFLGALVDEGLHALDGNGVHGRTARKKALFLVETFDNVIAHEEDAKQRVADLVTLRDTLVAHFGLPFSREARQKLLQAKVLALPVEKGLGAEASSSVLATAGPIPGDGSVVGVQNKGVDPDTAFQRPAVVRTDLAEQILNLFPQKPGD